MDYYELELPHLIIRRDRLTHKINLSSKIMLCEVDEYIKWRDMPKPFEIGQEVIITSGYHNRRTATIYGIIMNTLWVHIHETGNMNEISSSIVRHI